MLNIMFEISNPPLQNYSLTKTNLSLNQKMKKANLIILIQYVL